MYDFLNRIQWIEVSAFLTSGQPSLLMQLVALNAIFLIAVIIIRMRRNPGAKRRPQYFIQEALLLFNLVILSEDQFAPFYYQRIEPLIYNFKHWVL
jgi:hypothetical protein